MKKDALVVSGELLRIFTREVLYRSLRCVENDGNGSATVEPEHLEKIIVQFMLDFQ